MHASSILLALGILPAVIMAAPSSPVEERASCTTSYPDYARISEAQPVQSYLPGFEISQDAGPTNRNDMLLEFNVTQGAWGCQLEVYFPPGFPVSASGRQDVYVYSLDRAPLSKSPFGIDHSWAYAPNSVSQVGTVKFASEASGPTRRVINSFVCKPKMTYRLSIGSDFTDAGSISYDQSPSAGLRMTYC